MMDLFAGIEDLILHTLSMPKDPWSKAYIKMCVTDRTTLDLYLKQFIYHDEGKSIQRRTINTKIIPKPSWIKIYRNKTRRH